jgi:hypothetical protein
MRPYFLLLAAIFLAPSSLLAQDPAPRHLTSSIGLLQYDFAGAGFAPMLAVRGTMPISSVLILEAGVLGARPQTQLGQSRTFLVPEAQIHLAIPFSDFIPYMGLGTGVAIDLRDAASGGSRTDLTISGSLGLRAWLGERAGVHVEYRGRGIGVDFDGSSSEYTAGMIWRI